MGMRENAEQVEKIEEEFNAEWAKKEKERQQKEAELKAKLDEDRKNAKDNWKNDPDYKDFDIEVTYEYRPALIELSEKNQIRDERGIIVDGYQYYAALNDSANIEKKRREGWVPATDCKATNSDNELGCVQQINGLAGEKFIVLKRSLALRDLFKEHLEEKRKKVMRKNLNDIPQTQNGIVSTYGKPKMYTKKGR